MDALFDLLNLQPQHLLVDLGCGVGADAAALAARTTATAIGLDKALTLLAIGATPLKTVCGDALALPFKSQCADAAMSVNLMQLLPQRSGFFQEVARILQPWGTLVFPFTNRQQLHRRFLNRFFPGLLAVDRSRYPSAVELRRELAGAGFVRCTSRKVDLGYIDIDLRYLARHATGITSGLSYLASSERSEGFDRLAAFIDSSIKRGSAHRIPWIRTIVQARKGRK